MSKLFSLGKFVTTSGILDKIPFTAIADGVLRHARGDWGDVSSSNKDANERALKDGSKLFSVYEYEGTRFLVITEADRSVTTALLPEEY